MDINGCMKFVDHWPSLVFKYFFASNQMEEMENVNDEV